MKSLLPVLNDIRTESVVRHPDYIAWLKIGAHRMCVDIFASAMTRRVREPDLLWSPQDTMRYVLGELKKHQQIDPQGIAHMCEASGNNFAAVMAQRVGEADGEVFAYIALMLNYDSKSWDVFTSNTYGGWDNTITNMLYQVEAFWINKGGRPTDRGPKEAIAYMNMLANWQLFATSDRNGPLHLRLARPDVAHTEYLAHLRALLQVWDELESVGAKGAAVIVPAQEAIIFDLSVGMGVVGAFYEKARRATWMNEFFTARAPRFEDLEKALYRRYRALVDLAIAEDVAV